MAVTRTVLNASYSIGQYYRCIEKSGSTQIIITDMITTISGDNLNEVEIALESSSQWLLISETRITVLMQQPGGTLPTNQYQHANWGMSRLVHKNENLYVIKYDSASIKDMEHRDSVIGYAMGTADTILVHVDQDNDRVFIYYN